MIPRSASWAVLEESWLVYSVFETFAGEDLNGDGDTPSTCDPGLYIQLEASYH